jgi:uncharacterized protein
VTAGLTAAQARRIALGAQGFADPRPTGRVDRRHVRKVFDRVGLIQIDSVNVCVRSHHMPLFSRLGPYPRHLLDTMTADGELFEYWGHEASYLPIDHHPLMRLKMEHTHWVSKWAGRIEAERPGYLAAVMREVEAKGPMSAGELDDPGTKEGPWWGWNHGKRALELLFYRGDLSARRRPSFEREYDLTERMLPAHVVAAPTPDPDETRYALLELAARSLGVATEADLTDYYRLNTPQSRVALRRLVDEGRLEPVHVEGWARPAYLHPEARVPRRVDARALLTPFDSLVWFRERAERIFDFRYRIEIYTPAPKRVYGYYVMPFLLGDALVARVDLKADRQAGVLRAQATWAEPGVDEAHVATELAAELHEMAGWLGLEHVEATTKGNLSPALRRALR